MDLEQEIAEKANKAPRVTPANIEAEIASEHYFTAAQGTLGAAIQEEKIYSPEIEAGALEAPKAPLDLLTFCVLILKNGHRIVGVNEGPVSAANFDAEIGRKLARQKAVDQLWPLLGFRLRDTLAATKEDAA